MDPKGLTDDLLSSLEKSRELDQKKENTVAATLYKDSMQETLELFRSVSTGKEPVLLTLLAEKEALRKELEIYSDSKEMLDTIQTEITNLEQAEASYKILQQPEVYKQIVKIYPDSLKMKGLPLDAFREFSKDHLSYLENMLLAGMPKPLEDLVRQRKANLMAANEMYMELQHKALPPED